MFIAVIGTPSSGVSTVVDYLVSSKGFVRVRFTEQVDEDSNSDVTENGTERHGQVASATKHMSFLSMDRTPLPSPVRTIRNTAPPNGLTKPPSFSSSHMLLDYATRNWRTNFVTDDFRTREVIEAFVKRPFFMLVGVDAPLLERFRRSGSSSLEEFVRENDALVFGSGDSTSLRELDNLVNLHIVNEFRSISALHAYLDDLNLLDPRHLRPDWDSYFMTLASLASLRSNCMKRRVGALLVRDKRIVATGYNGTPWNLENCNNGGCPACNGTSSFTGVDECLCLHAEENALLEAGRDRIGKGSVLYCNTCPCLKCCTKIIQTGVSCVVYNLAYKVDAESAKLFREAGVELRQFDHRKRHLPVPQTHLDEDILPVMDN